LSSKTFCLGKSACLVKRPVDKSKKPVKNITIPNLQLY
jgi:hypothetical protein